MIATWGQGMTAPKGLKDAGCLHPSLAGTKMVSVYERLLGNLD
jgi:poly [ADP-ribose] polymerase